MTDKEAIKILLHMLEKYPLDEKEQDAIKSSIGILGWTKMLESKVEARKKETARLILTIQNSYVIVEEEQPKEMRRDSEIARSRARRACLFGRLSDSADYAYATFHPQGRKSATHALLE